MDGMSFAQWLKRRRRVLGMTQKELALAARCSVVTIEKLESGERRPSRQIAELLAEALTIPSEEREAFVEFSRLGVAGDGAGGGWGPQSQQPWRGITGPQSPQTERRPPSNLPAQHTAFIGREELVTAAKATLKRPGTRLLTLTGPPGIGKTRLAIEIASGLRHDFADGTFFVPLASISAPDLVGSTIARVLGLRDLSNKSPAEVLGDYLATRRMLLVLDNFEQVLGGATLVSELLTLAPGLTVVATSREALDLYAEREIEVPPLVVPDHIAAPSVEELLRFEAVRLFRDRAQAARYDFEITAENAQNVALLCSRLDGLPLAIELAAGRVKEVSPEGMLVRLEDRLALLSRGPRDLPQRQRTLRGAIDWSYDLLSENEKGVFRWVSLFAGGCSVEDAVAVYSPDGELEDVRAVLRSLSHKSLLKTAKSQEGAPTVERFFMLESIAAYSRERLEASGELPQARKRFAGFFLSLAESAERELRGADQLSWLNRLEAEHDNLRVALRLSIDSGEPDEVETALGIAGALWRFWLVRGYGQEALGYLQEALSADVGIRTDSEGTTLRAKALNAAGVLASTQGRYHLARDFFNDALRIQRSLGDDQGVAALLSNLGNVARTLGEYDEAWSLQKESLEMRRALADKAGMALSLSNLGNVAQLMGRREESARYQEESLVLLRELGDQQAIATSLNNLAAVVAELGQQDKALDLLDESLRIRRQLGDKRGIGKTLLNLGNLLVDLGEYSQAQAALMEGLSLHLEVGDKEGIVELLEGLAIHWTAQQMWRPAVRLWGAASALREEIHARMSPARQVDYEKHMNVARLHLGKEESAALWREGGRTLLESGVEVLLEGLQAT
jgi:predicted ATPase/DNA-binding XRE family transcriptional regulator